MNTDAFLCDAATVREGLLHILGGGITRLWRDQFPAPMQVALALNVQMHPAETGEAHRIKVLIQTADGQEVGKIEGEFQTGVGPGHKPGEMINAPIVLPLHNVGVQGPGQYSIEILIDGQLARTLPFIVAKASEQPPST